MAIDITPCSATLRPATAADADAIIELYEGLSAESRYNRFFRATPRYDRALVRFLTDVSSSTVWLAFDGERCVGEARVTSARDGRGDLAVVVADDHRGRGLGRRLSKLAVRDYLRHTEFVTFSILPTNRAALRVARRSGLTLKWADGTLDGVIERRVPSVASMAHRPAAVEIAA